MVYPPFAMPGANAPRRARRTPAGALPSINDFLDELPSIDDFIDFGNAALPSINDFLAAEEPELARAGSAESGDYDAEGWAIAGWQSFDWSGAAALGKRAENREEAADAWNTVDWSPATLKQTGNAQKRSGDAPPSADEVARALDGIARRIRSGELLIDQISGTPPEAAMAAALAALLRLRD